MSPLCPVWKRNKRRGVISRLWARSSGLGAPAADGIMNGDQFKGQILRERAYSDRTGSRFVLLTLDVVKAVGNKNDTEQMRRLLTEVVCERARISDSVGWYGQQQKQIGLILPGTSSDAASCLIRAVENIFHERVRRCTASDQPMPEISCKVFTYLSGWGPAQPESTVKNKSGEKLGIKARSFLRSRTDMDKAQPGSGTD